MSIRGESSALQKEGIGDFEKRENKKNKRSRKREQDKEHEGNFPSPEELKIYQDRDSTMPKRVLEGDDLKPEASRTFRAQSSKNNPNYQNFLERQTGGYVQGREGLTQQEWERNEIARRALLDNQITKDEEMQIRRGEAPDALMEELKESYPIRAEDDIFGKEIRQSVEDDITKIKRGEGTKGSVAEIAKRVYGSNEKSNSDVEEEASVFDFVKNNEVEPPRSNTAPEEDGKGGDGKPPEDPPGGGEGGGDEPPEDDAERIKNEYLTALAHTTTFEEMYQTLRSFDGKEIGADILDAERLITLIDSFRKTVRDTKKLPDIEKYNVLLDKEKEKIKELLQNELSLLDHDSERVDTETNFPSEDSKDDVKISSEQQETAETVELNAFVVGQLEGFGLSIDDLRELPHFNKLSTGKQLLVFENLRQLTYGRIQEEAEKSTREDSKNSRWLGRVWKGLTRQYHFTKHEKAAARDIQRGGLDVHRKVLSALITLAETGPDVKVDGDGSLEIQFVSGLDRLSPEEQSVANRFNTVANEFAAIPEEWRFETAPETDRKKYDALKKKFEVAKKEFLALVRDHDDTAPEQEAMIFLNDIEEKIRLNQFLNTHPDVEQALKGITDRSAWEHAVKTIAAERGAFVLGGFVTRSATASLLGWVAAPLVAAGIGGIRARKRSTEEMRTRDIAARKGMRDESKEAKNYIDVGATISKLDNVIEQVLANEEDGAAVKRLRARIRYTREKMDSGRVNYGAKEQQLLNKYSLIEAISRAEATLRAFDYEQPVKSKLEERLDSFLGKREETITAARSKKVRRDIIQGAVWGAGFALAGTALRDYFGFGETSPAKKTESSPISELAFPRTSEEPSSAHTPEAVLGGSSNDGGADEKFPPDVLGKGKQYPETLFKEGEPHVKYGDPNRNDPALEKTSPETVQAPAEEPDLDFSEEQERLRQFDLDHPVGYAGGSSVWEAIGKNLDGHGYTFEKNGTVDEAMRTHVIDFLKDKIQSSPEKYGLTLTSGDIDKVTAEELQKTDWDSLLRDSLREEEFQKMIPTLSQEARANILENNRIVDEYVSKSGKSLDSDSVDQVIRDIRAEGSGSDAVDAYVEMEKKIKSYERYTENPVNAENRDTVVASIKKNGLAATVAEQLSISRHDAWKKMSGISDAQYNEGWQRMGKKLHELSAERSWKTLKLLKISNGEKLKGPIWHQPASDAFRGAWTESVMEAASKHDRTKLLGYLRTAEEKIGRPFYGEYMGQYLIRYETVEIFKRSAGSPLSDTLETAHSEAGAGEMTGEEQASRVQFRQQVDGTASAELVKLTEEELQRINLARAKILLNDRYGEIVREMHGDTNIDEHIGIVEFASKKIYADLDGLRQLEEKNLGDSREAGFLRKAIRAQITSIEKTYPKALKDIVIPGE